MTQDLIHFFFSQLSAVRAAFRRVRKLFLGRIGKKRHLLIERLCRIHAREILWNPFYYQLKSKCRNFRRRICSHFKDMKEEISVGFNQQIVSSVGSLNSSSVACVSSVNVIYKSQTIAIYQSTLVLAEFQQQLLRRIPPIRASQALGISRRSECLSVCLPGTVELEQSNTSSSTLGLFIYLLLALVSLASRWLPVATLTQPNYIWWIGVLLAV